MSKQGTLMPYDEIYAEIKETLLSSRQQTYVAVNFAMVKAYWQIGRIIVEHENAGDFSWVTEFLNSRLLQHVFLRSSARDFLSALCSR